MSAEDVADVKTGEWFVDILSSVKINVTDPEHILRAVNNHTDARVPAQEGEEGWGDLFYGNLTVDETLQHLAFNCVVNGVEDASRLDGWGDLAPGQLTMEADRMVEYFGVVRPAE